ncbi:MAG: JAB domain-containing protein [Bacillota bacterium]|nr:JAB domain-containing protein [Bacillota bacterium]
MDKQSDRHKGHRNRMKQKFIENGLDVFHSHEALEMLLYYAVPRKDTNELAHKLLEIFGSLSAIFDAPIGLLKKAGLSESAAVYLKLIPEITRLYQEDKHQNYDKIITDENIGEILVKKFIGRENENVILLLMDSKGKELFCGIVSKGSVNASEIYIKKLIETAVLYNASTAVLAHNHPSGMALPSKKDLDTTKKISVALRLVGVQLSDHIIVADGDFVSLAACDFGEELFI